MPKQRRMALIKFEPFEINGLGGELGRSNFGPVGFGKLIASSVDIAKAFEKRHDSVLRDIRDLH
jgi:phage regulator Rha-like protein